MCTTYAYSQLSTRQQTTAGILKVIPPAHARRGLIICSMQMLLVTLTGFVLDVKTIIITQVHKNTMYILFSQSYYNIIIYGT